MHGPSEHLFVFICIIDLDFFFTIVHVIQKLVNWSDKKIMLVPQKSQKSAGKASCNRSPESSLKADVASVIIDVQGSEKISNVSNAPTSLPTASGITSRRKRKKKRKQMRTKNLSQRLCEAMCCKGILHNNESLNILNQVMKNILYIFLLNLML